MRIVIGEDSALFREGLASLLTDSGHEVVARAVDAPSLLAAVDATLPALVVIDIRMPPGLTDDGARAARAVRAAHPGVGIARRLWLTERTVETHIGSIMAKPGLTPGEENHRRAQAVLVYLDRT